MESSSLNKAHQQQRKAEALFKQNKFDECIQCHKSAIVLLMESMSLTDNQKALESLKLQKAYHAKQIDLIRVRQKYHENNKKIKSVPIRKDSTSSFDVDSECEHDLKSAIFHNIVVQDSLIDRLEKRRFGTDYDSISTSDETDDINGKFDKVEGVVPMGNKHPKDDSTTIEELRILSGQLQELVQLLVTQLDERNKEVETLKQRINQLENKGSSKSSLKVVTDSSGGISPYVISPCSELSPDVNQRQGSLPNLTPLDLPNFDYNSVFKRGSSFANNINNN